MRYSSFKDRTDYALNHMENYALGSTRAQSGQMTPYEISLATTRTIGLKEVTFGVPDGYTVLKQRRNEVVLVDVGGQRMERKKWHTLFPTQPNAIVLVRSLTEYAYVLFEDETVNRFEESRRIGAELINNPIVINSPIFIILNKFDEFCGLIKQIPFGSKVLDYYGPNEPDSIIQWICDDIRMGVMMDGGTGTTSTTVPTIASTTTPIPTTTSTNTFQSKSSIQSTSRTNSSTTTRSSTASKTAIRPPHNLIFLPPISAHNPDDCNTMFDAVMSRIEADEMEMMTMEEEMGR